MTNLRTKADQSLEICLADSNKNRLEEKKKNTATNDRIKREDLKREYTRWFGICSPKKKLQQISSSHLFLLSLKRDKFDFKIKLQERFLIFSLVKSTSVTTSY